MPGAILIVDKLGHPDNAPSPMLVVLAGIDIADNALQFAKALPPMLVTPDGIAMDDRLEQPLKALLPMLEMPGAIAMLVSERQLLKADAGIDCKDACRLTEPSDVHPEKTPLPIVVTLLGTDTFDKLVQFANALSAILRTLFGMLTLVMALPAKAFAPIEDTPDGILTAPPPPV